MDKKARVRSLDLLVWWIYYATNLCFVYMILGVMIPLSTMDEFLFDGANSKPFLVILEYYIRLNTTYVHARLFLNLVPRNLKSPKPCDLAIRRDTESCKL